MSRILVTGCAGFIGFHLSKYLIAKGEEVIGIDNLNDYYEVQLKRDRLKQISEKSNFNFVKLDLIDRSGIKQLFKDYRPQKVVHLAAQAGVRYSLENPEAYIDSNLVGFGNILEGCRNNQIEHLVFASSSSVYGANTKMPFSVTDNVDHPISLYAATKKANELMSYTYSHLYKIPTTGLRFFTVYGPWGRPDMALFTFTKAILEGKSINVFNYGKMKRDFTYIDDIIEGIVRVIDKIPTASHNVPPHKIYNIGNNYPVELGRFIEVLENTLGIKADKKMSPIQPGDVLETYADIEDLTRDVGFKPTTSIEIGIPKFVEWYRSYYQI